MAKLIHNVRVTFTAPSPELREQVRDAFADALSFEISSFWSEEDLREPGFDTLYAGKLFLDRQPLIREFVDAIISPLSPKDLTTLREQVPERVDVRGRFFFRLDLDTFVSSREVKLVERGEVLQLRINLAAFPKTQDRAREVAMLLLSGNV